MNSPYVRCLTAAAVLALATIGLSPQSAAGGLDVGGLLGNTIGSLGGSKSGSHGATQGGSLGVGAKANASLGKSHLGVGAKAKVVLYKKQHKKQLFGKSPAYSKPHTTVKVAAIIKSRPLHLKAKVHIAKKGISKSAYEASGPEISKSTKMARAFDALSMADQRTLSNTCTAVLAGPSRYGRDTVALCRLIAEL